MMEKLSGRMGIGIVSAVIAILFVVIGIPNMWENLDASEIMVIQSPVSGDLDVYIEPGLKWQGFGKVTKYPRQAQYSFCSSTELAKDGKTMSEFQCEKTTSIAKRLRFNDGGHAMLNGAVNWEMPLDKKSIIEIHKKFGSAEGVESRAVGKMLDAATYLAGPLMSSTESSGERRAELVQYINDQAENGVYATRAKTATTKEANGAEKTIISTEIIMDTKGMPKRQQGSILGDFNIKLLPLSISELKYDGIVEKQIAERQNATTQVQIAQANARKSEQDAITVEAQGKAKAASAKWDQETIKAKEVTKAQQELEVATLGAKTAEQYKREQILRGEGEAERKRLVMNADGALDPKLKAYIEVNKAYAAAMGSYTGNWVPNVQMGNGGTASGAGAQNMIDLLSVKAARDLGLDMSIAGKGNTGKK
jgi:regulator of protease activity HflC (stomatin/prohibitin superfamily)